MDVEALNAGPLVALDYLGITVFAVSGALVAADKKQNLLTFVFFAVATGVGGGTLRDVLIGAPVFWVHQNSIIAVCIGAALAVWFFAKAPVLGRAILWFDAVGLVAYAIYGTEKALQYGIAPVPASFIGMLAACAGGIVRDLMAQQTSIVLRPEVYVTAAAVAACVYSLLGTSGVPVLMAALAAATIGFGLRAAAIWRGLSLPSYRG